MCLRGARRDTLLTGITPPPQRASLGFNAVAQEILLFPVRRGRGGEERTPTPTDTPTVLSHGTRNSEISCATALNPRDARCYRSPLVFSPIGGRGGSRKDGEERMRVNPDEKIGSAQIITDSLLSQNWMKAAESRATPTLIIAVVRGDHTLKSDFIYQCLEQETTEHEQTEQVVFFTHFHYIMTHWGPRVNCAHRFLPEIKERL